jgi:hypothetical protein
MNLTDFVSETILSIITGVRDAQEKAAEHGAHVNPAGLMRHTTQIADNAIWDNRTNVYAQPVSFDIAITAEDTAQGGAKIKVLTGLLGGDIGGEKGSKNAVASRVQFVVPVLLPAQDIGDPNARKSGRGREVISKGVQP